MVGGKDKAVRVAEVLEGPARFHVQRLPIQLIDPPGQSHFGYSMAPAAAMTDENAKDAGA